MTGQRHHRGANRIHHVRHGRDARPSRGSTQDARAGRLRLSGKGAAATQSYSERLASLTQSLNESTKQVDAVLAELSHVAGEREKTVQTLEANLASLEGREKDLQKRIEDLQKVPIPAVEHFAKLLESGEKRSAWRDYILFGSGVLVSTAIAIGLKFTGLG